MSEKKGMIFDFNGTLVLDSHIHKAVWTDFFPRHGKEPLSEEEMEKNLEKYVQTMEGLRLELDELVGKKKKNKKK